MELRSASKVINSGSPEAKDYDFSSGNSFLLGDVEFRTKYFHCAGCQLAISVIEMKQYERQKSHCRS